MHSLSFFKPDKNLSPDKSYPIATIACNQSKFPVAQIEQKKKKKRKGLHRRQNACQMMVMMMREHKNYKICKSYIFCLLHAVEIPLLNRASNQAEFRLLDLEIKRIRCFFLRMLQTSFILYFSVFISKSMRRTNKQNKEANRQISYLIKMVKTGCGLEPQISLSQIRSLSPNHPATACSNLRVT